MLKGIESITLYSYSGSKLTDFAITSSSKYVENLMGDTYLLLDFYDEMQFEIPAFCFVVYNNKPYFVKENYHPARDGKTYHYELKLVPFELMLSKFIFFRQIDLSDGTHYEEADFSVSCDIATMLEVWKTAVKSCYNDESRKGALFFFATLNKLVLDVQTTDTTLNTYSFSGVNLYSALNTIVNANSDNVQEWWITVEYERKTSSIHTCTPTLHVGRCELGETISLKDEIGGNQIYNIEYRDKWENITNSIIPYGAERNMDGGSGTDTNSNLEVSYGKRIRLEANTNYTVKNASGEDVTFTTNSRGGLSIDAVNSKIEEVKMFEDVYPQCHYQVVGVAKNDNDIYTVELKAKDETNQVLLTRSEMYDQGLSPYANTFIQEGETLKMVFESGALQGQEFEVSNDYCKVELGEDPDTKIRSKYTILKLQIKPNTLGDQQIPLGNFAPKASEVYGQGDTVALFGMKMPEKYVTLARQQLAQKAYTYLEEVAKTRPAVNVDAYVNYFNNIDLGIGSRVSITSSLFGTKDEPGTIVSRVIKIEYDLFFTGSLSFVVSSSQVTGLISQFKSAIADVTEDVRGVKQEAKAISRRGYRDAQEMSKMLDTLTAQMMLVGDANNQFAFSSTITPNYKDDPNSLDITYGVLQHTQEPFISGESKGVYTVNACTLTTDVDNAPLDNDTPYYLYARLNDYQDEEVEAMELHKEKSDRQEDLLVGILSSVFENKRVFNRTNGYTSIAGGTITTEVAQDSARRLIIDFPNATITARNGGKFVGNFSVTNEDNANSAGVDIGTGSSTGDSVIAISNTEAGIIKGLTNNSGVSYGHGWSSGLQEYYNHMYTKGYGQFYFISDAGPSLIESSDIHFTAHINGANAESAGIFNNRPSSFDSKGVPVLTSGNDFVCFYIKLYDSAKTLKDCKCFYWQGQETREFVLEAKDITDYAYYSCGIMIRTTTTSVNWELYYAKLYQIIQTPQGGALSANLIVLKNASQKIIGGISGLADNVGMWLGGTYGDAVLNSSSLPFFISKNEDGNGSKFGPLQIEEDGVIKIPTNSSTVYITSKTVDQMSSEEYSRTFNACSNSQTYTATTTKQSGTITAQTSYSRYSIPAGSYTCVDNGATVKINILDDISAENPFYLSSTTAYLTRTDGVQYTAQCSKTFTAKGEYTLATFDATTVKQSLSSITQRNTIIQLDFNYNIIEDTNTQVRFTITIEYNGGTISGTASSGAHQFVIASDGIIIQYGSGKFICKSERNKITAQFTGLPTSSSGLSSGTLYSSGGYVRIAQ